MMSEGNQMDWEEARQEIGKRNDEDEAAETYWRFRANLIKENREFGGIRQKDIAKELNLSQPEYAKCEQPRNLKSYREMLSKKFHLPAPLLHSKTAFMEFSGTPGGQTFLRLIRETIEYHALPKNAETAQPVPVQFIRERLEKRLEKQALKEADRVKCMKAIAFLDQGATKDIDLETKQFLEAVVELYPGSVSDPEVYKLKQNERIKERKILLDVLEENVTRLMNLHDWSVERLMAESGLGTDIAEDGKLTIGKINGRILAGLATTFKVPAGNLLIEDGPFMPREAMAAISDLPAAVRRFVGQLQRYTSDPSSPEADVTCSLIQFFSIALEAAVAKANTNEPLREAFQLMVKALR
jgi:transcriptional regulator with XRE-family HTH domain